MKYFFFNYNSNINGLGYTVIFDCWQQLYSQELSRELKEFHTYQEQRKKSVYIYPNLPERQTANLKESLVDVLNKPDEDIILLSFNHKGLIGNTEGLDLSELFENGILNIVKRRNAVLESDDSFHYVLPSEKHSPFFIRTGNIFSNSEEVNFIALKVISIISGRKINYIACDTSSILALPFAVNYLLSLFGKQHHIPFDSFGSYASVEEYEFHARTLVIISASNSGRLLKRIESRQVDIDFITILFNGENPTGDILINLKGSLPDLLQSTNKKQFDSSKDCDYCKQNSTPVVVRGDQFMPSRILIQRVLISKPNVPNWIKSYANSFIASKAIYTFKQENRLAKKRELFIEIEKAIKDNKSFNSEFKKYLRNNIPASASIILHLPDKSSKYVADQIAIHLKELGGSPILMTQTQLKEVNPSEEHLILVVASCVTTGNKLNSISRDLREFNKSSIHYLAVINRLADASKYEVLKKNLEFRADRDNVNRFTSIFDCHLGDYHCNLFNEADKPSWEQELEFWKRVGSEHHPFIKKRVLELNSLSGLQDNLFLPKPNNLSEQLRLRKNFAFHQISSENLKNLTQADLYLIVAGVFHYLRNPKHIKADNKQNGSDKYLIQHEHVKTIIDPICFKRYNDGIIQAAFLRIANNSELNYSVSDRDSLEMLETLKDIFKDPSDTDLSEALLEFLYAIAVKKLKLKKYHHEKLIEFIKQRYSDNELVMLLAEKSIS